MSMEIFALIESIVACKTFDPESLSETLGLQLVPKTIGPPYWEAHNGDTRLAAIQEVQTIAKSDLLRLFITPHVVVTLSDLHQRFGKDLILAQIPSPHGGPRVTHYELQRPWGMLRFYVANDKNDRVIEIAIEAVKTS